VSELYNVMIPLLLLWGIVLILFLFNKSYSPALKVITTAIYIFILIWYRNNIIKSIKIFIKVPMKTLGTFGSSIDTIVLKSLFILWPITLFVTIVSGNSSSARTLMKIVLTVSIVYISLFLLDFYVPSAGSKMINYIKKELIPLMDPPVN